MFGMADRLRDELYDVVTYAKMAREATCDLDRQILSDIAREEYTHAKHLADMMRRHEDYQEPTVEWQLATDAIRTL